jgi:HTH-type transcriptional regulator/antitoxin HigA
VPSDDVTAIPLAFHPSEFIQDELDARGWTLADLAARMGSESYALNRLSLDMYFAVGPTEPNCRIGEETAERMGRAFDVSPQFFLNLEAAWLREVERATAIPEPPHAD